MNYIYIYKLLYIYILPIFCIFNILVFLMSNEKYLLKSQCRQSNIPTVDA